MIGILHSPPQLPSSSSSSTCVSPIPTNNDGLHQQTFLNNESFISNNHVALYRRNNSNTDNNITYTQIQGEEREGDQESVLAVLVTIFRKSLVGCKSASGVEEQLMEIGRPTNVRHVAHVTFDRFNGFLGLPVEFEPEVPRRPPSASTRVFGVSTESMQLSFDSRGNCVPTILLMMQRRLYSQGGLKLEGIFRINPENGQEEYVREQLNNGVIPDNIDVNCLAGLIKAWFRELPTGVLDSLSTDHVMQARSEDECIHLVRLLPPTEAALLDWSINLMADVAQLEHLNKMNARNIAMVFAPNMTQMSDPITALMYAVQVMNFLKTLIIRTLREREDSILEASSVLQLEPSDDGRDSILEPKDLEANNTSEEEEVSVAKEPMSDHTINSCSGAESKTGNETHHFLSSIENILPDEKGHAADVPNFLEGGNATAGNGRSQQRSHKTTIGQLNNSINVKKGFRKQIPQVIHAKETAEKSKESGIFSRINSQTRTGGGLEMKFSAS